MRFHVVSGPVVHEIVSGTRPEIVEDVRAAYLLHDAGATVNPPSSFLRFPERPDARIIALPAYLGAPHDVAGIKWIASFPANVARNVPRASAVLILNDAETGYPYACLEAAQVSVARTAASAVLAAEELAGGRTAGTVAVVGAGIIARGIVDFFAARHWSVERFVVYDPNAASAAALVRHAATVAGPAAAATGAEEAIAGADLVVLATTASTPHLTDPALFHPGQNVLNISLRDLAPEVVAGAHNVLDDVDHCLTAGTSPHLAEQRYGNRDFVDGTLAQLLRREVKLSDAKPRIFSPFGLGVLDLAVGLRVFATALDRGLTVEVPDFFAETERWR